jgi:hypothetical protein
MSFPTKNRTDRLKHIKAGRISARQRKLTSSRYTRGEKDEPGFTAYLKEKRRRQRQEKSGNNSSRMRRERRKCEH